MSSQVVEKINLEINAGLHKESQVVYIMTGIRKIIEQENLYSRFPYLNFYCNWMLHAKLTNRRTQIILNYFDNTHKKILAHKEDIFSFEFEKISKMEVFKTELSSFMYEKNIIDFSNIQNVWTYFLYLYSKVISGCPLETEDNADADISRVVVSVDEARELQGSHRLYRINWNIIDKEGKPVYARVVKGGNDDINEMVERKFESMPQWKPAIRQEQPVAFRLKQTIVIEAAPGS